VHSNSFFRTKAQNIVAPPRLLIEHTAGGAAAAMDALLELPGVAGKPRMWCWPMPSGSRGVTVDTHVRRLSQPARPWSKQGEPRRIEPELMKACCPSRKVG